ncbi:hypothetical protein N0V84_005358 [Fusarium piperis]|uniref:Uncharacterized protein n=1 Tax=Fusarium piperis TaxID=1435070 RepID=A0A9W8WDX7_9HYPO|nr:hypothetical protein N0V84_005358 [Fusarium piperis]
MACTFQELMDQSNAHGYRYRGEPGDLFIRKAQMMMYTAVDGPTLEGLHGLILAIESIKKGLEVEHDDFEAFKAHSWYVLCDAMSYFANQPSQEEPRHKFTIADTWDPRKEWIRMTHSALETSEESGWGEFWEEFLIFWEELVVSKGKGQKWYKVNESKWFMPFEEVKEEFKIAKPEAASWLGM